MTVSRPTQPRPRRPLGLSLTLEERLARGKAARVDAPRSGHAAWAPAPDRPDPIALLEEQGANRIAELVPVRYGRMLVSPFTFFRGAALIMAADLASTSTAGITVQLCGDAHLSNFGVFGSPERKLIFDINDFDETLPGPWEWDVKRLAASFEVAGRELGFSPSDRREIVMTGVGVYRRAMRRASKMRVIDAWYDHVDTDQILSIVREAVRAGRLGKAEAKEAEQDVAKARTRDHARVFGKRADEIGGQLRFVPDPPLIVPIHDLAPPGMARDELDAMIHAQIQAYRRSLAREHHPIEEYRLLDTARKVVGVGSVGTHAWMHLFVGRDDDDPLILQSKEAQPSVLARFLPRSAYRNDGQRVVVGQHLMQAATDIFLGWWSSQGPRRAAPRLLQPPTARLEGQRGGGDVPGAGCDAVRGVVRSDAGTRARALGRSDRDRLVSGQGRRLRPGDRRLLDGVRGSERAGLRGVRRRRRDRTSHRRDRSLSPFRLCRCRRLRPLSRPRGRHVPRRDPWRSRSSACWG